MRDRYLAFIDQIVETTLKGQIRSKEQVYQKLAQEVSPGTGEIFERCLDERVSGTEAQIKAAVDELKKSKPERILRALKTIQGEWERYQKDYQATAAISSQAQAILNAEADERLLIWLRAIDANQPHSLTLDQLKQLAADLERTVDARPTVELKQLDIGLIQEVHQLITGIKNGLASWQQLEDHLVDWMYEQNRQLGFEGVPGQQGPWAGWAKYVSNPFVKQLFQTLALNQSVADFIGQQQHVKVSDWVELAIVFPYMQRGLIAWFEKQPYDSKWGTKQAIATSLTFAAIWAQFSQGFEAASNLEVDNRQQLAQGCFQVALQILRAFSQRPYFPLYGGVFALFSGSYLRDTLSYLDEPLRQAEGTQEKARILTLLGYSQRAAGQTERAMAFHQRALEIAQEAGDNACVIANLNHLSRTCIDQKNFPAAISHSQRALVLSRQNGDRLGEANALTNLGYSEVLNARQQQQVEPEAYETAIEYLKQGLKLSEQSANSLPDSFAARQSQALCYNSLGIAHVVLGQLQPALAYLESGVQAANFSGDLYLLGLNFSFLAEVTYALGDRDRAIHAAALGMYLLEQIHSDEWRQPAGLLSIIQGQLGEEGFQKALAQHRAKIIPVIGIDGYDHLPTLLETYRRSLE
ncbi:tetratricopeptide repeat protein [Kovacikia minuta CCNUW1]|uniref:tetratricopeptide repeat protein n=1 Tax=Kovacikia minuta TaxID=2931930 RepID=UPI001CD030B5|nr:tetratricopeptide repeat protein [Kovacikia minuta CCNUW1]